VTELDNEDAHIPVDIDCNGLVVDIFLSCDWKQSLNKRCCVCMILEVEAIFDVLDLDAILLTLFRCKLGQLTDVWEL
jgi:hypothetical protein